MLRTDRDRPQTIIGPLGEALDKGSLPPSNTSRWVVRRKAEVVAAVNGGLLTITEACERYDLSLEELASWQRAVEREGWEVPDLVEPVEDACEPCTAQPVGASEAAPETVPTGAAQTAADGDTQTDTNLTVGVVEETT